MAFDAAHRNRFTPGEVAALVAKIGERGYEAEMVGAFGSPGSSDRLALMDEALRQADSLVVAMPVDPYSGAEIALVQQFVQKGGRLLLVGEPARESQINSLAEPFGIGFQRDYLYNLSDYDLNFQYIYVKDFLPDELTQGLSEVVLYGAGSITSLGPGLASAGGQTRSTLTDGGQPLYTLVRGNTGQVVGLSDLTFMVPPQDSILDNERLLSNLASFLTVLQRRFELADFPHFFQGQVQVVSLRPQLFSVAIKVKDQLTRQQVMVQLSVEDDPSRDAVVLGLFGDAARLVPYLEGAGVRVGSAVSTSATGDLPLGQTALLVLHRSDQRNVLVALADTPETLGALVGRLGADGDFRRGLVDESVGVYRP